MRIVRVLHRGRLPFVLGLLGLLALGGGCGGGTDPNASPAAPATTPEQQQSERDARQKAYGKSTIQTKESTQKK
jgi:hypothetical protein